MSIAIWKFNKIFFRSLEERIKQRNRKRAEIWALKSFRDRSENKMEGYCQKIIDVLNDDLQCAAIYSKIVDFIVSQDTIDFDDRKTFERKETTDELLSKVNEMKKFINQ